MKNGIRKYTCIGCGVEVVKSCTKTVKYCTPDCYHKHGKTGRKKTGKNITCVVCNKSFYVPKYRADKAICCSADCQKKWQDKKKTIKCEVCKKDFKVSNSFVSGRRFCSMKCRDNSESVLNRLIEMNRIQQSKTSTKIERIGYEVLKKNDIHFEPQKLLFNKFCVDAFIPSINTVVQFDGDYWHGNPEFYQSLDHRQKKRVSLDASQDRYFEKCGIRVVRIWGSEILDNPQCIIDKIF